MTAYSQNNTIENTSISSVGVGDILSKRRPIWILVSAIFCAAMIVISPGLSFVTVLVFALSLSYVLAAIFRPDKVGAGTKFYPLAGVSLAASLLWIAFHAGANATQMLGLANSGLFITFAISTAIFAGLIIGEFAMAIAMQLFISRNRHVALQVSVAVNSKYAELFAKVR
ncbi:MAG: hypothetical protein COB78_01270 [Hyphomicrobiales bacterium]|nr:MAG: hypothetical protein COB78_01270 [Hyphomicrobiales bacterium]